MMAKNWMPILISLIALFGFVTSNALANQSKPLLVFAAASLKDALEPIAADYEKEHGQKVRLSFAGTATLANQLKWGAPADVFISADTLWSDWLISRGLIEKTSEIIIARNRLALVAPTISELKAGRTPEDYLRDFLGSDKDRIAIADPENVPAGRYAKAALTSSSGLFGHLEERAATTENVRLAALLVARGEVPLGVVYESDAIVDERLKLLTLFDERSHPPIVYPAALTSVADNSAKMFLEFLQGTEAKSHFWKAGF